MLSSLRSPMIDQSAVVFSPNTPKATKVPSLRSMSIPCTTADAYPVASMKTSVP